MMIAEVFCLLLVITVSSTAHNCQVPLNRNAILPPTFDNQSYGTINPSRLRIERVFTDSFRNLPNYHEVVKKLVEPALQKLEEIFRIRVPKTKRHYVYHGCTNNHYGFKEDGNGKKQHYCVKECADETKCYDTVVPTHVIGECRKNRNGKLETVRGANRGVDADFVMIITSSVTAQCSGNLLAYAISCQSEIGTDRPEVGMMNICPYSIKLQKSALPSSIGIVMHEALHAMGFAESHYANFRDSEGKPITPRDPRTGYTSLGNINGIPTPSEKILKIVQRKWLSKYVEIQRDVKVLVTPTLLRVAREHYNCPNLDGVEMESQGGSTAAGSHFEKRTLMNELMTGSNSIKPVLSKFTLAFFQDSGWYDVDLNQGASLNWGKGLGCDFVYQSCYEYMYRKHRMRQPTFPWCDRIKYTYRNAQFGNFYGRCILQYNGYAKEPEFYNINYLKDVPRNDWRLYNGDDPLADYCPYIKEMDKQT